MNKSLRLNQRPSVSNRPSGNTPKSSKEWSYHSQKHIGLKNIANVSSSRWDNQRLKLLQNTEQLKLITKDMECILSNFSHSNLYSNNTELADLLKQLRDFEIEVENVVIQGLSSIKQVENSLKLVDYSCKNDNNESSCSYRQLVETESTWMQNYSEESFARANQLFEECETQCIETYRNDFENEKDVITSSNTPMSSDDTQDNILQQSIDNLETVIERLQIEIQNKVNLNNDIVTKTNCIQKADADVTYAIHNDILLYEFEKKTAEDKVSKLIAKHHKINRQYQYDLMVNENNNQVYFINKNKQLLLLLQLHRMLRLCNKLSSFPLISSNANNCNSSSNKRSKIMYKINSLQCQLKNVMDCVEESSMKDACSEIHEIAATVIATSPSNRSQNTAISVANLHTLTSPANDILEIYENYLNNLWNNQKNLEEISKSLKNKFHVVYNMECILNYGGNLQDCVAMYKKSTINEHL